MKKTVLVMALLTIFAAAVVSASAQTTAFTYQGRLTDNSIPANGTYNMKFRLYDADTGNGQIDTEKTATVTVTNGAFEVNLDFNGSSFTAGSERWLEVEVETNTLSPRRKVMSSPYAVRSLKSNEADAMSSVCNPCVTNPQIVSLDGAKVTGLIPAGSVPTGSNNYIQNNSGAAQTGDFNMSGNGIVGGNFGVGAAPGAGLRFDVPADARFRTANGNINFGTPNGELGMSFNTGTNRADLRFDGSALRLLAGTGTGVPTNGIAITTSNVQLPNNVQLGVGTNGNQVAFGSPNSETGMTISGPGGRADLRYDGTLKLVNGPGGVPPATNGIAINTSGNVGMGTVTPNTRLTLSGGPAWTSFFWTASMNLQNASAFGWEANASGQRFGIGQSTGGLHFLRTNNDFGNTGSPPSYDLVITDTGNITQPRENNGLVKAMVYVNASGGVLRCYNSFSPLPPGFSCGIGVSHPNTGVFELNFGFQVNDRFINLTLKDGCIGGGEILLQDHANQETARVVMSCGSTLIDRAFYVFVF